MLKFSFLFTSTRTYEVPTTAQVQSTEDAILKPGKDRKPGPQGTYNLWGMQSHKLGITMVREKFLERG